MPGELDELFGEGLGQPRPRTRLVVSLLAGGLVLAVAGMACTAAPGGALVLVAWMVVEKELDRVETGYLPADDRPRLLVLRRAVYIGVLVVIGLFAVQGILLCNGFYDQLFGDALRQLVERLA